MINRIRFINIPKISVILDHIWEGVERSCSFVVATLVEIAKISSGKEKRKRVMNGKNRGNIEMMRKRVDFES